MVTDWTILYMYIALFCTVYYIPNIYCLHCIQFDSFIPFIPLRFPFFEYTLADNYCWSLCNILILEVYSRYFDPVTKNCTHWSKPIVQYSHQLSKSINIILQICAWFWLCNGFSQSNCHYSRKPGYTEPISPIELQVDKTVASSLQYFDSMLSVTSSQCIIARLLLPDFKIATLGILLSNRII
jgi:hypothetical protein